jgi:hypothetical protein
VEVRDVFDRVGPLMTTHRVLLGAVVVLLIVFGTGTFLLVRTLLG